jgi:adenylate cyclase
MIATMNTAQPYRISVEAVSQPVQAMRNGIPLAECADTLVMHETGLQSYHYFPRPSVMDGFLTPSERRTFCPFKGTASYWHLNEPDGLIENAAFSYETPFAEVREIAGHIAFMDHVLDQPLCLAAEDTVLSGPLIDWLLREAWMCKSPGELTEQFAGSWLPWVCRCGGWVLASGPCTRNWQGAIIIGCVAVMGSLRVRRPMACC